MSDPVPHDDIYIPQGSTFMWAWPLIDADTGLTADPTGWSARCEMRTGFGGDLVTRFHSDSGMGWDGTIDFDADANLILGLTADLTAALPKLRPGACYDVEMISPDGDVTRIVSGRVVVTQEVTTDG